jgi:hypothetical protein
MLDAIVIVDGEDPYRTEATARSLATLVEGVVDGGLARLLLVTSSPAGDLAKLADASGCRLAADVNQDNLASTLGAHLTQPRTLLLRAGCLLPPGWPDTLARSPANRALVFSPDNAGVRLSLAMRLRFSRPIAIDHGVIVSRGAARHLKLAKRLVHPDEKGILLAAQSKMSERVV